MTRQLLPVSGFSVNPATEANAPVVGIVEFLEIDLPTGTLYLADAPQAYTFGGHTYTPATVSGMPFGAITNYNEGTDGVPRPMRLTLSGCDQSVIGNLAANTITWTGITWSLGFLDANHNLLNGTPFLIAPMYLGDCTIKIGKNTGEISISAENLLADLQNRQSACLQTTQDQQQRGNVFSGDTFYSYCASLEHTFIYWGMLGPSQIGVGGPGRGLGNGGAGGGSLQSMTGTIADSDKTLGYTWGDF